ADKLLDRDGRMIAAIETIGRGALAAEATPFRRDLE
ncbi:MAG: protein tyrosine phosphatase, partial [Xanthobacteraceae bacterium]